MNYRKIMLYLKYVNNAEDLTKDIVQKFTSIKPLNKDNLKKLLYKLFLKIY